jgi:non-homologous end joining protein Ku
LRLKSSKIITKMREQIEAPKERAPAKVINLMDALRRSVEAERGGSAKRQAPSAERPKKKKSR